MLIRVPQHGLYLLRDEARPLVSLLPSASRLLEWRGPVLA
jgi:hypothetical protein